MCREPDHWPAAVSGRRGPHLVTGALFGFVQLILVPRVFPRRLIQVFFLLNRLDCPGSLYLALGQRSLEFGRNPLRYTAGERL